MKIVITGAAGFLGRALAVRLAQQGHFITALDNNFRGSLASVPEHSNIQKRHGDILNPDELDQLFRDADAVYHLAAINGTENFYKIPDRVLEVGILGTHNVLKGVLKQGIKRFYFASSSEVYNTPLLIPTPETVECRVSDVFNPRFSYGGSKLAGELMTINYLRNTGTVFTIFRPHNVYGPQMGFEHVIPQLVRKIMDELHQHPDATTVTIRIQGSGRETRSFIFIDDAVRAIELCTLNDSESGLIHIGTEDEISMQELVSQIGRVLGLEVCPVPTPAVDGSPARRCPDATKLRRLGFMPEVSLQQGLAITVCWYADYYRQNRLPS